MIYSLLINSVAVYFSAKLLDGVEIKSIWSAIVVAILLAIVNTFLKPVLIALTLPINLLTLGLFTFVIDALLLMLVNLIADGLRIKDFTWALVFAIVLTIINGLLYLVF